jgi:hypothetical protein
MAYTLKMMTIMMMMMMMMPWAGPFEQWDREFESRSRYGCTMFAFCCVVLSYTGRSTAICQVLPKYLQRFIVSEDHSELYRPQGLIRETYDIYI